MAEMIKPSASFIGHLLGALYLEMAPPIWYSLLMKITPWILAAAAAGSLVSAPPPTSAPEKALVKIEKRDLARVPAAVLQDLQGIAELGRSWLMVAADDELGALADRRIPFEVLDVGPAGKAYFLVFMKKPGRDEVLRTYGEVRVLDDDVSLFWSGTQEAREILPPEFEVAAISLDDRVPVPRAGRIGKGPVRAEAFLRRAVAAEAPISEMVARVSKDALASFISSLQGFQTRYASTASCESSGAFLLNHFSSLGVAAGFDSFTFPPSSNAYATRNVVATIPGKSSADRIVILGAHYDSYSNDKYNLAPGADDNGSGTAALMEMAKILAGYEFDFTLKFICFSAEEWGLYGSRHYAQAARAAGEQIIAVINLDMIGYTDRLPEDLDIVVNANSEWLANRMIAAAGRYAPLPILKFVNASFRGSDHAPFWDQGYSALCGIEDTNVPNPYYHRTTDTLSTLNMDFAVSVTRAALALAAELAQPISILPAPSGLAARSQIQASLFSQIKNVRLAWQAVLGAAGYHVYRATEAHGDFVRVNGTLLSETRFDDRFLDPAKTFFYAVTAVDAQGREGNRSVEVQDDADNDKTA
jgi:hypothetical protein